MPSTSSILPAPATSRLLSGRRLSEKIVMVIVGLAFLSMCLGALMFVPELRGSLSGGINNAGPHDNNNNNNNNNNKKHLPDLRNVHEEELHQPDHLNRRAPGNNDPAMREAQGDGLARQDPLIPNFQRRKIEIERLAKLRDHRNRMVPAEDADLDMPPVELADDADAMNNNIVNENENAAVPENDDDVEDIRENNIDRNEQQVQKNEQEEQAAQPAAQEEQQDVDVGEREEELEELQENDDSAKIYSNDHPTFKSKFKLDSETIERRKYISEMMKHAWTGYATYSWGHNEHRPNAKGPHNSGLFGSQPLGATIVDSLDTLIIMGMIDEYREARDWVAEKLDFSKHNSYTSVFETNIRWVGGLLSAYALSGDEMFKIKAKEIADLLLPAFDTPTGLPYAMINLASGKAKSHDWAGGQSILAEIGTLDIEFQYLSDILKDPTYRDKVLKIRAVMKEVNKPDGLYPNYISPFTSQWGSHHVSLGGLGDSFYEYLLKSWLISGKTDTEVRAMYDAAMKNVIRVLIPSHSSETDLIYVAETRGGGSLDHKMDHLACFSGGMFALGAEGDTKEDHLRIGAGITSTCHESYIMTATHIGPESFRVNPAAKTVEMNWGNQVGYILRPEVVESYFVLWRVTKDPKYREWGWDAAQAINKYCRAETGFAGIQNVNNARTSQDDVQQSFFLAETLKYLYLLFSEDDLISLDEWVFNTEAHPLPVKTVRSRLRPLLPAN